MKDEILKILRKTIYAYDPRNIHKKVEVEGIERAAELINDLLTKKKRNAKQSNAK